MEHSDGQHRGVVLLRQLKARLGIGVALTLIGCGQGPAGAPLAEADQSLPLARGERPVTAYERSTSDNQRPTTDQQRPVGGEQSLEGAAYADQSADLSDLCNALCADVEAVGCGGGCQQYCDEWVGGPVQCIDVLVVFAECIIVSGLECSDATEVCLEELFSAIEECPSIGIEVRD